MASADALLDCDVVPVGQAGTPPLETVQPSMSEALLEGDNPALAGGDGRVISNRSPPSLASESQTSAGVIQRHPSGVTPAEPVILASLGALKGQPQRGVCSLCPCYEQAECGSAECVFPAWCWAVSSLHALGIRWPVSANGLALASMLLS